MTLRSARWSRISICAFSDGEPSKLDLKACNPASLRIFSDPSYQVITSLYDIEQRIRAVAQEMPAISDLKLFSQMVRPAAAKGEKESDQPDICLRHGFNADKVSN